MEKVGIFFQHFVEEYLASPEDEKLPPFRLMEDSIVENAVSGHTLEWSSLYLNVHKCPVLLSNAVCAEVIKRISAKDLSFAVRKETGVDTDGDDLLDNSRIIYLDARKVIEVVFRTVDDVVREWHKRLPEKVASLLGYCKHEVSVHAIKNTRRKMEDRHLVVPLLQTFTDREDLRDVGLYAVFDGHGGVEAASYAAAHFLYHTLSTTSQTQDLSGALSQSLIETDNHFSIRAAKENLRCGSTAVVTVVTKSSIHISWLGDSQALLVRGGRAIPVMNPHKPERTDEKARIEGLGGRVVWYGTWRVNGNLAVSRAIGDVEHRPYVSGTPDSETLERAEEDEYLVVACDGLWDMITPDKVVTLVYEYLQAGNEKALVSEMLVREAKAKGSGDNITCVVVFFRDTISVPVPVAPARSEQENTAEDEADGNRHDAKTHSHRAKDPDAHSIIEADLPNPGSAPSDSCADRPIPYTVLANSPPSSSDRSLASDDTNRNNDRLIVN